MKFISGLLGLLLLSLSGFAQSFDFKVYNTSNGLADNDIIALEQDKNDYVWMATDEGLIRYDGIDYKVYTTNDSLAHNYINCLHFDPQGRLWIGHKNGLLSYLEGGTFHKLAIEGATQLIADLTNDEAGNVWGIDQKRGLFRIDKDGLVTTFFDRKMFGRKNYTALQLLSTHRLLVGTARQGVFLFSFSQDFQSVDIEKISGIPNVWITTIEKSIQADNYWIGTREKGFYSYHEGAGNKDVRHVTDNKLCRKFNVENEEVTDIYEEVEGHLLIATIGSGVIRLIYDPLSGEFNDSFKYSNNNGLSNNNVLDILCDREGNYWFGTNGGGVSLLVNQYFVYYNLNEIGFQYKARAVLSDKQDLWIGLDRGLIHTDPLCFDVKYYDARYGGIPNDEVIALYKGEDDRLWVATANSGLYFKDPGHTRFKKKEYFNDQLALRINGLAAYQHSLLLATQRGLFVLDLKTNAIKNYQIKDGLSHNNINFVFVDQRDNIWVGPKDGGLCNINIQLDRIERHPVINNKAVDVTGMTQDDEGKLWISTKGEGVMCYSREAIHYHYTTGDGLKKDFCYGIQKDIKNRLWVCHDGGLSRISLDQPGVIRTFGYSDDLGSEFVQVTGDDKGGLWFASNDGVVNYLPVNDRRNTVAPILNITEIKLDDVVQPLSSHLNLEYPYGVGHYNLQLTFRAISFKNPNGVHYEVKIEEEGADNEVKKWSQLGNVNRKEIDYLGAGNYKIRIRAFNADGVETSLQKTIHVSVAKPYWNHYWFYALVLVIISMGIWGLIRFRERSQRRAQRILEREVASKTVALREKNAEIVLKNQEITDSINYAKKIQSSILPAMEDLMSLFPESFVYFKPRDIVSGDFYWFNRSKDYFVACCADCTGHGVPGAFMSMIGTTILNDIFRLPEVDSPAAMLERLDEEVKKLLQKTEGNESTDGMDISVLEVHLPTRRVRLASAKRPVYLLIDNEMTLYKGSRRSIGDHYEELLSPYVNVEYNCHKGDKVYMFSDGYTDQFGGPLGKKFMKVGVQNMINEIHDLSGDKQYQRVKSNFENWQGHLEQIDDVLFMGIQL